MNDTIRNGLEILLNESTELCNVQVTELFSIPQSVRFGCDYYAKQEPVVIRNALINWPAIKKWDTSYLLKKLGERIVNVSVTPNGYADGLATRFEDGLEYFVIPYEERMPMHKFLQLMDSPSANAIYYIQKQNSNFSHEFHDLFDDIDMSVLQFASECFNKSPDAVNFWMGDERAVTSLHKDPYDNLYCVVAGYKDFILLPPYYLPWIPRKRYPTGVYKRDNTGKFFIDPLKDNEYNNVILTEWCSIDPLSPDYSKYPQYLRIQPLQIRVNAGDLLFLPNYWFHHVRQSHKCIALNFWYDMDYDSRYCFFRMLEELTKCSST